jgi:hypothetical protein
MGLKSDIRSSKEFKLFTKIRLESESRLNLERDRIEALSMHSGRLSRAMYGKKQYSAKSLLDACMNEMSCRSRLVEIRVQASIQIDTVHDASKAIKHHILTEYADQMKVYKTVGQRQAFIDNLIAKAVQLEGEGKALLSLLDSLISDIDKASYHLSNMVDVLKLMSDKPGKTL